MAATFGSSDDLRDARFTAADLTGAVFRDCDLRAAKITDSWLEGLSISGLVRHVVVNDVDVSDYVETELDRRHPERVVVREAVSADDYRAAWRTLEELWATTTERARALPESARQERVDGEWSFAETLRHLVFASDAWLGSAVLDLPQPYHAFGVPHSSYPPDLAASIGIDVAATPSFDEVVAMRADQVQTVRELLRELTEESMQRVCTRPPAPGYEAAPGRTVARCVKVVLGEECEHHRYAVRDLAVLEARA